MRKQYIFLFAIAFTFFINIFDVSAKEAVLSCKYKLTVNCASEGCTADVIYTLYDDGSLDLPFGQNEELAEITAAVTYWKHYNVDKFPNTYKEAAKSGESGYTCPYLGIEFENEYATVYAGNPNGSKLAIPGEQIINSSPVEYSKVCKYTINSEIVRVNINVELSMTKNGEKYLIVDGAKAKVDSSVTTGIPAVSAQITAGKYNDGYTYMILGNEIGNVFKQNYTQLENSTFTCPDNLYITAESFGDRRYVISSKKPEKETYYDGFNENAENDQPEDGPPPVYKSGCGMITNEMASKINWFLDIIKYGGVLLAIGLGMFDFAKAVFLDEADANKKASQKFIKRIVASAIIFIVPLIIQFLLNVVEIDGVDKNSPFCIQLNS